MAVKATARLRLLPGSQGADILHAVEGRIRSYPCQLQKKDGVVIMDGKDGACTLGLDYSELQALGDHQSFHAA